MVPDVTLQNDKRTVLAKQVARLFAISSTRSWQHSTNPIMYISITGIYNNTSAWVVSYRGTANRLTETPLHHYRQEAVAPPPQPPPPPSHHITTTVVLITSTKIVPPLTTSEYKFRTSVSPSKTSVPASFTGPSTEPTSSTTSNRPESTSSVPVLSTSFSARLTASSLPETVSETIQPTHTSPSPFTKDEGKHIALLVGLVVGSVVGAILLGLLIYWIYACYRGVNVCNCFSGTDEEDDGDNMQSYPMSGIGAAPRIDRVLRPSMSVQGVSDVH